MKYLLLISLLALGGCAGLTKKDNVAVACEAVASAGEAVAAAANAGRINQAQLEDARRLYHTTDKFCEPVVDKISPMDFAELLSVGAELARRAK